MRTTLVLFLLAAAALAACVAAASRRPLDCGRASVAVRNGNQLFVAGGGPRCLERAFARGCRAATFAVTVRGVDTSSSIRFAVARKRPCRVVVSGRSRVFGSNRAATWSERCFGVVRLAEGVAVEHCRGRAGDYLLSRPGAPDVPGSGY